MIRVLVDDDDFRVAHLHARYVEAVAGFEVVGIAHTARSAVEDAKTLAADLVLLDLYLPDARGTDIVPLLGRDVIMLTAASDAASVREAIGRGVVNYLVKPFSDSALADRLRAYATYRAHLSGERPLQQADIDRAARLLREGDTASTRRKARSSQTETLIIDALRNADGPTTAADVAAFVGVSRPTAQRYLSDLVDDGHVSVKMRYGTGRPEHQYRWIGAYPDSRRPD